MTAIEIGQRPQTATLIALIHSYRLHREQQYARALVYSYRSEHERTGLPVRLAPGAYGVGARRARSIRHDILALLGDE